MMRRGRAAVGIAITAALLIVLGMGGWIWWRGEHKSGIALTAVFTRAVAVYPGSDVRILGVRDGEVDSVDPHGTSVDVHMSLDDGVKVAASAGAVIVSATLVSDRYVQLTGVYASGAKMADGATIPLDRTATPIEIDQLYDSLISLSTDLGPKGANKNGALSDLLNTGAANLGGNGKLFNTTITKLGEASTTLANSKDDLFGTVSNLQRFTTMLAANDSSIRSFNGNLASVSRVLADDRQNLVDALDQLRLALGKVQSFIHDNQHRLKVSVDKLASITQTLITERDSIEQALKTAPLAVDNLINAYDAKHNTLDGRANVNELTIWADDGTAGSDSADVPSLLPRPKGAGS